MPTPTVSLPPCAPINAWLSALAVAQPDVSASAPPTSPAAPPSAPPAATPSSTGSQPAPVLPGMPQDAATPGTNPNAPATTGTLSTPGGTPAKPAPTNDLFMFLMWGMIALFVVMIFTSSRAQKREKKKREELMSSMRKGDKVQTIGGMIGKVVELRDDEVVLEGENPGTKFRFSRVAIQQVIKSTGASPDTTPSIEVKSGKEGSKV